MSRRFSMSKKTNQELFDAFMAGPEIDRYSDYSVLDSPKSERAKRWQKMGITRENAEKQAQQEYQEALEH